MFLNTIPTITGATCECNHYSMNEFAPYMKQLFKI